MPIRRTPTRWHRDPDGCGIVCFSEDEGPGIDEPWTATFARIDLGLGWLAGWPQNWAGLAAPTVTTHKDPTVSCIAQLRLHEATAA